MTGPTVIYTAARVRTLDPARPEAKAIAVQDGRVLAVGSVEEVKRAGGEDARVVDLGAATIVPGLVDAHAHLLNLGKALGTVNLMGTRSMAEAADRVRAAPEASYQGEWLVGRGWDQNDWSDLGGAFPDRKALDAAQPGKPVFLTRVDGHAAWMSTEGLRRAGITAQTPDPEGGRILRDAQGEPTGVLIDNAMDLVKLPAVTDTERELWLRKALARCAEVGLTEIHDAGMDWETFRLLQKWDLLGALPLRLYVMANGQEADGQTFLDAGPFQGRHLTMRSVKFWADGALGSRGAALHGEYADEHGHSGLLLLTPEELERRTRAFMERGFQVNIHAIGDRANTLAIDVLTRAAEQTRSRARRHRLEHAQILRLEDIPRIKTAGLVASMQPTHATSDMPWAEKRIGAQKLPGAYAWRRILDAGIPLAFGSDFPIELPDPLHGLYSARTRQDPSGQPPDGWLPDQRLTGEEALRGFTQGAAYAAFVEDRRGVLKEGMDADFVALSVDPVDGEPLAVRSAQVELTVVAGVEVHRRGQ